MLMINNKDTRETSMTSFWCLYIVKVEYISHLFLMFLLLTVSIYVCLLERQYVIFQKDERKLIFRNHQQSGLYQQFLTDVKHGSSVPVQYKYAFFLFKIYSGYHNFLFSESFLFYLDSSSASPKNPLEGNEAPESVSICC